MSTPRRADSKTAAKRRAQRRRDTRDFLRRAGAILIIAILVLGTISTVILSQPQTVSAPATDTTTQAAQSTATGAQAENALITKGDTAASTGDYNSAIGFYASYVALPQGATNADVHYKLGKAYLLASPPQYTNGLAQLQQALNINPKASWVSDAQSLITQNSGKVTTGGTPGASGTAGTAGTPSGTAGSTSPTRSLPGTVAPVKTP